MTLRKGRHCVNLLLPEATPAVVWRCGDSLLVEHQDVPLAQFAVDVVPDTRLIRAVTEARLFETGLVSPQPFLPDCGEVA